ncbi:MAG TPA: tRNA (adenosine(37)-N6)-threonylcarbamoyltransferase complex dimerization subunit type 1 TsaB [Planctomycetales bacterium]|jgi:tRNA threonylcarbamoyladenosine biosynthesis protein TsaB|nr:tRNA (adenosine(37)-N6)-threonylcarbamoyltransferase complex dimerization subunit type 1 TsaB [Planctomycetales bacterium]
MAEQARLLILETSGRGGFVAVAEGPTLLEVWRLEEARRHARDLAPATVALLTGQGWKARDLNGVVVSLGPGSYTGLRVGVMSAKTLAYAVGCALIGVETLAVVAAQAPKKINRLDVLADAQQEKVYVRSFARDGDDWHPIGALRIRPFAEWLALRTAGTWVSGPGLHRWAPRLPAETPVVDASLWDPLAETLLQVGLARYAAGERDDPFALEPLYLRPSSAEEQQRARQGKVNQ